jgi:hypothetical protein
MKKAINLFTILFFTIQSCISQQAEKQEFGAMNIDHESIAVKFMNKIKNQRYDKCYELLSEAYKSSINLEDFTFKMKMLNDLAGSEQFYHYKTTYIGKTAKEGLALLRGEKVTENIMPEYDFTVASEADKDFKTVQIFIRFDNENSDKISVINYAKHKLWNGKAGMSSVSSNPFFVGSYLLIAEHDNEVYFDIRGGNLRNKFKEFRNIASDGIVFKTTLAEIEHFCSNNDLTNFSLIYVKEKGESLIEPIVRALAHENGFSVFNHRDKEFISKFVKSSEIFLNKYREANWNPLEE